MGAGHGPGVGPEGHLPVRFICGWFKGASTAGRGGRGPVHGVSGQCIGGPTESVLKVVEFSFVCCKHLMITPCFSVFYQPGVFTVEVFRFQGLESVPSLRGFSPRPRVQGFSPVER